MFHLIINIKMNFCKYKIIKLGNQKFNISENDKINTNVECSLCSETIVNKEFQRTFDL